MKRRYELRADGKLVDRDGRVLGRLVSCVIELEEKGGTTGGDEDRSPLAPSFPELEGTDNKGGGAGEGDPVAIVWAHYAEVMRPRNKILDSEGRRIIREALKVARGESNEEKAAELCRAIDGCKASPWHMGENPKRRKYNRLSQILKAKRGVRTTREQIDFFLDIAEKAGLQSGLTSGDQGKLRQARLAVLDAWQFPGDEQVVRRGEEAAEWLRQNGWVIEPGEGGRPTFKRADG